MSNQHRKKPGIAAIVVGAKCKKLPHHPGHGISEKANDEPALLPPLTTKFDIKVNLVGDPQQLGLWVDCNRGRCCSCLAIVRHRCCRIEEEGAMTIPVAAGAMDPRTKSLCCLWL
jgi:hypothetical protein